MPPASNGKTPNPWLKASAGRRRLHYACSCNSIASLAPVLLTGPHRDPCRILRGGASPRPPSRWFLPQALSRHEPPVAVPDQPQQSLSLPRRRPRILRTILPIVSPAGVLRPSLTRTPSLASFPVGVAGGRPCDRVTRVVTAVNLQPPGWARNPDSTRFGRFPARGLEHMYR